MDLYRPMDLRGQIKGANLDVSGGDAVVMWRVACRVACGVCYGSCTLLVPLLVLLQPAAALWAVHCAASQAAAVRRPPMPRAVAARLLAVLALLTRVALTSQPSLPQVCLPSTISIYQSSL